MQISGSWQLDLDRLVERISEATAEKVLLRLHQAAAEAVQGAAETGELYEPEGGPAGSRHSAAGDWEVTR